MTHTVAQKQRLHRERERILTQFDPIGFLGSVMLGEPQALRDWEGAQIGTVQPGMDHRMSAATVLAKKAIPDLKSVDISSSGEGLVLTLANPLPLPGSLRPVDQVEVAPEQIAQLARQIEDAVVLEDEDD